MCRPGTGSVQQNPTTPQPPSSSPLRDRDRQIEALRVSFRLESREAARIRFVIHGFFPARRWCNPDASAGRSVPEAR